MLWAPPIPTIIAPGKWRRAGRHVRGMSFHRAYHCCCCPPNGWLVTLSNVVLDTTCFPGATNDCKAFSLSGINGTFAVPSGHPCGCLTGGSTSGGSIIEPFTTLEALGYFASGCTGDPDFEFESAELAITLDVRRADCMVTNLLIQTHSHTQISGPVAGDFFYPEFFFKADGPGGGAFALDTPTESDTGNGAIATVSEAP